MFKSQRLSASLLQKSGPSATRFMNWASSQRFIGGTVSGAKNQSRLPLVFLSEERKWHG